MSAYARATSANWSTAWAASANVPGSSSMCPRNRSSRLPRFLADCVRCSSTSACSEPMPRACVNAAANGACRSLTVASGQAAVTPATSGPERTNRSKSSSPTSPRTTTCSVAGAEEPRVRWNRRTRVTVPSSASVPFEYRSSTPDQVAPWRRWSATTSPVLSSVRCRHAPRTYETTSRSPASRSVAAVPAAATLNRRCSGGVSTAATASTSDDLPEPEWPVSRKPSRGTGTTWCPEKVPQLTSSMRARRHCPVGDGCGVFMRSPSPAGRTRRSAPRPGPLRTRSAAQGRPCTCPR